jgi:hypothetical protein
MMGRGCASPATLQSAISQFGPDSQSPQWNRETKSHRSLHYHLKKSMIIGLNRTNPNRQCENIATGGKNYFYKQLERLRVTRNEQKDILKFRIVVAAIHEQEMKLSQRGDSAPSCPAFDSTLNFVFSVGRRVLAPGVRCERDLLQPIFSAGL